MHLTMFFRLARNVCVHTAATRSIVQILVALQVIGLANVRPLEGQSVSPPSVASSALPTWFAGCWEQRAGNRVVQEQWMTPAASSMIGMSRTIRSIAGRDSTTEFEFLRVVLHNGELTYEPQPNGRPPTVFRAESATDSMVAFVNPQNPFPQRIIYRRVGPDSLVARIEGPRGGTTRGIDFRYARVSCR
jgi:hypothetical protein